MSEETFDNLIEQLASEDYGEQRAAINKLGELGDPCAVVPLIDIVHDPEQSLFFEISEALKHFEDVASDILMKKLTNDEDPLIRAASARLLRELMSWQAVEQLILALKDPDARVRRWSAYALYYSWDYRAVLPLIPLLKDGDSWVRREAAWALGVFHKLEVVKPLIETLKDEDKEVRKAAADSLRYLRYKRAVGPLIKLLNDSDTQVKGAAVEALGELKSNRSVEPLITLLEGVNDWLRHLIVRVLGDLRDARAVEPLSKLINDIDERTSKEATRALKKIGPVSIPYLIEAFKTSRWEVCQRVATNLSHLKETALQPLLEALKDADSNVRFWTCVALGRLGNSQALAELEELAQNDEGQNSIGKKVKTAARKAIEQINNKTKVAVEEVS